MIEPVLLATAQKCGGAKKLRVKQSRMKWVNSDVTRFHYKVTIPFHLKLKMFPCLCQKVVNTYKIHN